MPEGIPVKHSDDLSNMPFQMLLALANEGGNKEAIENALTDNVTVSTSSCSDSRLNTWVEGFPLQQRETFAGAGFNPCTPNRVLTGVSSSVQPRTLFDLNSSPFDLNATPLMTPQKNNKGEYLRESPTVKTPQQKAAKRKHRPKVIIEGSNKYSHAVSEDPTGVKRKIQFSNDKETNTVQGRMNPGGQMRPKSPNGSIYKSACLTPERPVSGLQRQNEAGTKMNCDESESNNHTHYLDEHALVPYQRSGVVVPFDGSFDKVKRRIPRAEVDLDDETNRVWRLLLENINSEGIDGDTEEMAKWWEEERRVLTGRAMYFIKRMHFLQGDRRFSEWKGSVVDSVVGVFLTQNVSDHLSSSAFMSMAARFPLKLKTQPADLDTEEVFGYVKLMKLFGTVVYGVNEGSAKTGCGENRQIQSERLVNISEFSSGTTFQKTTDISFEGGPKPSSAQPTVDGTKAKEPKKKKEKQADWDQLRKNTLIGGTERAKSENTMDSVDWEAVRCADVNDIAETIKDRGMNNVLAERIKDFLNRIVKDHGSIDLEWLRDVSPDKAKEYLLSIVGLGLKSVECVRLLTLHHIAFPVDVNVARVAVRLGWVPLRTLPDSLQIHLLELYPVLESVQKYLWPRLCKLDQRTLYELHYQMITFGKVFCTKAKPNCNACPMKSNCRHFASAVASARLALPAVEEEGNMSATGMFQLPSPFANEMRSKREFSNSMPIIEEPPSPRPIDDVIDIESVCSEEPDEIPTIHLNMGNFTHSLQKFMEQNTESDEGDISKALVALTSEASSIPMPKLKNINRLRTEHQAYELPDSHPLLEGMDKREPEDPCHYLFALLTQGETTDETCSSNNQTVMGTVLIPCRTAMRGRFPLNGTYFQVNEVFSDHESSLYPINIPRQWLWNLQKRTVYFGTSVQSIFKGMTAEDIQICFWKGFVCVRGFDRRTRAPRPLVARLHLTSKRIGKAKGMKDEK